MALQLLFIDLVLSRAFELEEKKKLKRRKRERGIRGMRDVLLGKKSSSPHGELGAILS